MNHFSCGFGGVGPSSLNMKSDEEIMEAALVAFAEKAREKFMQGIREHNPNGDKGLDRMTLEQRVSACKDEIIDLWFYLHELEKK